MPLSMALNETPPLYAVERGSGGEVGLILDNRCPLPNLSPQRRGKGIRSPSLRSGERSEGVRSNRKLLQNITNLVGQAQSLFIRSLPHIPSEDKPGRARLHRKPHLVQNILIVASFATRQD